MTGKAVSSCVGILAFLGLVAAAAASPASQKGSAEASWPQWRGPNRDGIAGPGPKLADAWPGGGPKLLWKSGPIPNGYETQGVVGLGGQQGGLGNVTVVGEKAFIYVHWKQKAAMVAISTRDLNNLGWTEGVPDEVGKKIDEETVKARKADPSDKRREPFIAEFLAAADPKLVETLGPQLKARITIVWRTHPAEVKHWPELAKIAEIRDKEFATFKELMAEFKKRAIREDFFYGSQELADHLQTMGNAYTDTIVCLDTATGKELWKKDFPGVPSKEMCYVGASGTPAVRDGKCYASGSAGLYCLSADDGAVVWQVKTTFTHSSPLVSNGGVFVMLAEGLGAFDAKTGQLLWRQPKVKSRTSSVAPWASGGKSYLMAVAGDSFCVDAVNGEVMWKVATHAQNSTPVICGDVMLNLSDPLMHAIGLSADKGELRWSKPPGSHNDGNTPVIYQGHVYQTGARYTGWAFRCRDLATGELKWEFQGGNQCTSAIAADGKIFTVLAGDRGPRLIMFKATPEKFELLGLGSIKDPVPLGCTPSIANGKLYVRLADCVACYDITAAGNPDVTVRNLAVVIDSPSTTYVFKHDVNSRTWNAISTADKGDSIEVAGKDGKSWTIKKTEIDDVIQPGMQWKLGKE